MTAGHPLARRQEYLRAGEVAQALGVSRRTVLRWCLAGELPYERTGGGQVRVPRSHVEQLLDAPRAA